ncbi:MAG: hypothetical protein WBN69_01025 [Eudoraea sp.]
MKRILKVFLIFVLTIIFFGITTLWFLADKHNITVRQELIEVINDEFEGEISFGDLRFSYLKNFPNAHIELTDVVFFNSNSGKSHFDKINVVIRLGSLFKDTLRIKKLHIENGFFSNEVDSLGRKPKLFGGTKSSKPSENRKVQLESGDIEVRNTQLFFGNQLKRNKMYILVENGKFSLSSTDSTIVFKGNAEAKLDSLISNGTILIKNQPAIVKNAAFEIHRVTGVKELLDGQIFANNLKLIPSLKMIPKDDGNLIDFHILGDGNLNAFVELFEFYVGSDLEQLNPNAELEISYNQEGFVNPFKRPYFHLDFKIKEALIKSDKLRFPLSNITVQGNYNNGSDHRPATAELKVDTLNAEIENSFLRGRFKMTNLSDPIIDAHLISQIDLGHFLPDSSKYKLEGIVALDIFANGKISELKQLDFDGKEAAKGVISFNSVKMTIPKKDPIHFTNGTIALKNHFIKLNTEVSLAKESAIDLQGEFDNLDQYLLGTTTALSGKLWLGFDKLDMMSLPILNQKKTSTRKYKKSKLPRFSFDLFVEGKVLKTKFGTLNNIKIASAYQPTEIDLNSFAFNYQKGKVSGSGKAIIEGSDIVSVKADLNADFKDLNFSLPQKDSVTKKGDKKHFSLPSNLEATIDLKIAKGILFDIPVKEFNLLVNTKGDHLDLGQLSFKTNEGTTSFKGNLDLMEGEISQLSGRGKIALNKLVLDKYLKESKMENADTSKQMISFTNLPKKMEVDLLINVKDVRYKDQYLKNLKTKFSIHGETMEIQYFKGDLSFGELDLRLAANKIRTPDIFYSADLNMNLNAINLNTLLKSEVFGIPQKNERYKKENKGIVDLSFPINWKVNLNTKAKSVRYKNAVINNVDLVANYGNTKLELSHMKFNFGSGEVLAHGFLKKENNSSFPSYIFCKSEKIDLSEVLEAFNNFKQDEITYKNTDGKISWQSDLHFNLIESFDTPSDSDLWKFKFRVHDAEFRNVKVIEETLSFIGQKAKDDFLVKELDIVGYLDGQEFLFKDVFINNNIVNMDVYGKVNMNDSILDLGIEASLSDLLFRSKKKRMVMTRDGEVSLDNDLKVFLNVLGPKSDRKVKTFSKNKFNNHRKELSSQIQEVESRISKINAAVKGSN